ncbi:MAG: polyprenyl diphosphate synthase [Pseudomonadota bacterium]
MPTTPSAQLVVPCHIAIVMDGNGRWAEQHGFKRSQGHRKGAEAVRHAIRESIAQSVKYLTLFCFSSENWNRPTSEINLLMDLLVHYLELHGTKLVKEGVRLHTIGAIRQLPEKVQQMLVKYEQATRANSRLHLTLAINYGGRQDIVDATQKAMQAALDGQLDVADLKSETYHSFLSTAFLPDPDLIVRTSGEMRLSNFLLWQAAYAELLFIDKFWPEFTNEDLIAAISEFRNRRRRFGALPA